MSNTYLKAAFVLLMSRDDAALLRQAEAAVRFPNEGLDDDGLAAAYETLDDRFRALFPPKEGQPFGHFIELFEDPDNIYLDADIDIGDGPKDALLPVTFTGEQFGVVAVANLLFHGCKSALPCGFAWSYDCDRLRVGEFGGGCVVITADGPEWHNTQAILDRAFERIEKGAFEGVDGLVLATRDREHGLSFWNNDAGFGALATATVFSEREAAAFDKPIADDEPEFMALPAPSTAL